MAETKNQAEESKEKKASATPDANNAPIEESAPEVKEVHLIRYVCMCDLMYENTWHRRGDVIEIPSNVEVKHKYLELEDPSKMVNIQEAAKKLYDPYNEAFSNRALGSALTELGFKR